MYRKIEARIEAGGIRVALSRDGIHWVDDFIYVIGQQWDHPEVVVHRLYGRPLSGRIKMVAQFTRE